MTSPKVFKINLPPGTPIKDFATCRRHAIQTPEQCSDTYYTTFPYNGELKTTFDQDGVVTAALFGSPGLSVCSGTISSRCAISLKFNQTGIEYLKSLPQYKQLFTQETQNQSSGENEASCGNIVQCFIQNPLFVPSILALLVSIVALCLLPFARDVFFGPRHRASKWSPPVRRHEDRLKDITGVHEHSQTSHSYSHDLGHLMSKVQGLQQNLQWLKKQYLEIQDLSTSQKLLWVKIEDLESKLDMISKPLSPSSDKTFQTNRPSPQPLNQEILKQAVAMNNYSLISAFPHFFLTEASESREERISTTEFVVDGSHESWQNHSNSEYIAIELASQFVLIPNIVPNATNPIKTLQALATARRIYTSIQGSTGLSISDFAVVTSSSNNKYILFKPGTLV